MHGSNNNVSSDKARFFDELLGRVRAARQYLSNEEIVEKIASEGIYSREEIYLCLKAAEVLEKPFVP